MTSITKIWKPTISRHDFRNFPCFFLFLPTKTPLSHQWKLKTYQNTNNMFGYIFYSNKSCYSMFVCFFSSLNLIFLHISRYFSQTSIIDNLFIWKHKKSEKFFPDKPLMLFHLLFLFNRRYIVLFLWFFISLYLTHFVKNAAK